MQKLLHLKEVIGIEARIFDQGVTPPSFCEKKS